MQQRAVRIDLSQGREHRQRIRRGLRIDQRTSRNVRIQHIALPPYLFVLARSDLIRQIAHRLGVRQVGAELREQRLRAWIVVLTVLRIQRRIDPRLEVSDQSRARPCIEQHRRASSRDRSLNSGNTASICVPFAASLAFR